MNTPPPLAIGDAANGNGPYTSSAMLSGWCLSCRASTRLSGTLTNRDLFVSHRDSVTDAWQTPEPLSTLNTAAWESCPALSLDEHRLYFTSPRTGTCGGQDLRVSRRQDRRDDFGWEPPVNLGCHPDGPNSVSGDQTPTFFEDEAGRELMYFTSFRSGNWDHYESVGGEDGAFGSAMPIAELNSGSTDQGITVRRDGLEVLLLSNRPGGSDPASLDFWSATRSSTADPWSTPVFVPSLGNPAWAQGRIALSFDGRELYFTFWNEPFTGPDGWPDLWVAKRDKLGGKK